MKRINSIYRIFVLFLAIIVVSFLILYCYSTINLKTSLRRVAKIQMEYSYDQLEQKIKEIELEASSILTREETKLLQVAIVDNEDIYSYVMKVFFRKSKRPILEWQSLIFIGQKNSELFQAQR